MSEKRESGAGTAVVAAVLVLLIPLGVYVAAYFALCCSVTVSMNPLNHTR